jgi:hypothetical protein
MERKDQKQRVLRAMRLAAFLARDPVAEARAIVLAHIAAKKA